MRKKLPTLSGKLATNARGKDLDIILEKYMSKLEQKVVSQTHQLKTITDNATSCLFMINRQGLPTFMNPAAEKTTGYSLIEIKDNILHNVIHNHDTHDGNPLPSKCLMISALINMQQVKDQEDIFIRKDKTSFPVSFSISPLIQEDKSQGAVLEFQDITKRKELERQKDDFLAVASHELKTPVTSMKTYTQVLKTKFERQGDTAAAAGLSKIDAQINKLSTLIADLLDVTRTQTGNLSLHQESFDVDELIKEVVENMQLTTQKHTIETEGEACTHITADRDRTAQILINFLSNAIKYSPQSTKIIVEVSCNKREVVVSVKDFGIGIPKDKTEQVFGRFMRVPGRHMETFPGLGLGLYISSQIIERQGGRIWVESQQGEGSTFYFSLPLKPVKI